MYIRKVVADYNNNRYINLIYKEKCIIETIPLAPIVVEILLCRGSAQKIETDSGMKLPEKNQTYIYSINLYIYIVCILVMRYICIHKIKNND